MSNLVDTLLNMMLLQLNDVVESGRSPRRGQTTLSGQSAYYNIYECRDGKYLSVGAFEPWFWAKLCRLLGVEEFAERQHPEPGSPEAESQVRRLREVFLTRDRDDWTKRLMFEETCVAPVLSLDEVLADRDLHDEDLFARPEIEQTHRGGSGLVGAVGDRARRRAVPAAARVVGRAAGQKRRGEPAERNRHPTPHLESPHHTPPVAGSG